MRPSRNEPTRVAARAALRVSVVLLVLLPLLLALWGGPACAASGAAGKVVVLVVDRVGPADIPSRETPFISGLARQWSYGMMTTRTTDLKSGKVLDSGAEFITLGAGAQASGAPDAALCFNSGEQFQGGGRGADASAFYRQYTGRDAAPGSVVSLDWPELLDSNGDLVKDTLVGGLGRMLAGRGLRAAVVGNSDDMNGPRRLAPLICADDHGYVPLGDVASLQQQPGVRVLGATAAAMLERTDLLVVDSGATGALDRREANTTDAAYRLEHNAALRRADLLAQTLAGSLDLSRSLLVVISPGAPETARLKGNYLTPLVIAGTASFQGTLTSPSTRRSGLVSNTDFAPTLYGFFGIKVPGGTVGSPMVARKGASPAELQGISAQLSVTQDVRWPIVIVWLVLIGVVMALVALCVLARRGVIGRPARPASLEKVLAPVSLVLLATPISFMLVSPFRYSGFLFPVLFVVIWSLVVGLGAWALSRWRKGIDPVVVICLLTAAIIMIDQFTGGRLNLLPLLGSISVEGLRFFGFSNVVVGLLIATVVWGEAGLLSRWAPAVAEGGEVPAAVRWCMYGLLVLVAFVTGLGVLGANFGGLVTASVTLLVFAVAASKRGLTLRRVGLIVVAVVSAVFLVTLCDTLFFRTHTGRAVGGGVGRLLPILARKATIALGQIRYLLLPSLLMITIALALVLWMRRPGSRWELRWKIDRAHTAALYALSVGGIIGLLFKDTGITLLGAFTFVTLMALSYYQASGSPAAPVPISALEPEAGKAAQPLIPQEPGVSPAG